MLKVILCSLLFIFTKNQENEQSFSMEDKAIITSLGDSKSVFTKPFDEPISHNRKLLNDETVAPTLEPTRKPIFIGDVIIPKLYKASASSGIIPSPIIKHYYSKQQRDLIYIGMGAAGTLLLIITCCGVKYAYKKWQGRLTQEILYEIEMQKRQSNASQGVVEP